MNFSFWWKCSFWWRYHFRSTLSSWALVFRSTSSDALSFLFLGFFALFCSFRTFVRYKILSMVLYTWTNISNTNCQFLIPCYHQNSLRFIVKHILFQQARPRRPPSPTPNRRGGSPRPSRSRSPRHSVSVRAPSYSRRSTRRRSPRRSPPRRSPPRSPHQDTTGDLGLLLVSRIAVMPGMTATLTIH